MASTKNEQKSPEEQLFVENSPLYKRMSIICHVVIYLYATAFWIQVGVFPFLSKKLNVDTVVFGYLQTVFAVAMLMGGPIFGRMGDIFGVKIVFLISFGGSFLFYFFVAIADGVFYLFISRSMAFTMNAMQCAQMVITDVTGTRDRATSMGHLTVAYGLGMITGPTVGGWIAKFSNEQNAAAVSAILMILAFLIILFTVPNHTKDPRKLAESKKMDSPKEVEDNKRIFDISAILKLLSIPEVFYLISIRTIIGIPAGVFHSMFSVVNIERFNLTPEINGYLLTYIGLLTAVRCHVIKICLIVLL
jgi:OCT family organic cation transporter-like MFS transporter 18